MNYFQKYSRFHFILSIFDRIFVQFKIEEVLTYLYQETNLKERGYFFGFHRQNFKKYTPLFHCKKKNS